MKLKIEKLNANDLDLIPLHSLLAKDIYFEFQKFEKENLHNIKYCDNINYNDFVNAFDEICFELKNKKNKLDYLSSHIDSLLCDKSIEEKKMGNINNAYYYVERALQYNRLNTNALYLYMELLYDDFLYQEVIFIMKILYTEAEISKQQEAAIGEFNLKFYHTLYNKADSLIKKERATEALELFQLLENFCTQLPIEYCNDDYYHGILISKAGIYQSYLLISKVAKERGNNAISAKFVEYAQDYKRKNKDYFLDTVDAADTIDIADTAWCVKHTRNITGSIVTIETVEVAKDSINLITFQKEKEVAQKPQDPNNDFEKEAEQHQKELKYNKSFVEAVSLCLSEKYREAYKILEEAKELEKCNCFKLDDRIDTLYKELKKYYE